MFPHEKLLINKLYKKFDCWKDKIENDNFPYKIRNRGIIIIFQIESKRMINKNIFLTYYNNIYFSSFVQIFYCLLFLAKGFGLAFSYTLWYFFPWIDPCSFVTEKKLHEYVTGDNWIVSNVSLCFHSEREKM